MSDGLPPLSAGMHAAEVAAWERMTPAQRAAWKASAAPLHQAPDADEPCEQALCRRVAQVTGGPVVGLADTLRVLRHPDVVSFTRTWLAGAATTDADGPEEAPLVITVRPGSEPVSALGMVEEFDAAKPFYQDNATGEPCPKRGRLLCTITDPEHRHVACHMADQTPDADERIVGTLAEALCECGHRATDHDDQGCVNGWPRDSCTCETPGAEALAPTVARLVEDAWPCENYRAPLTCLTAPSSETGRCDHCVEQAGAAISAALNGGGEQ